MFIDLKNIRCSFENMVIYKEKLLFTEISCNELYSYDLQTKEMVLLYKFNEEEEYKRRLFAEMIIKGNCLYLAPFSAEKMYILNLDTNEVEGIEIRIPDVKKYSKYTSSAKFISIHSLNDSIYMVGATYPAIVEYNSISKKMTYFDVWLSEVSDCIFKEECFSEDNALFRKTMLKDNKIFAPLCQLNAVLEFDIKNYTFELHRVGSKICKYSAICYDGQYYWLAPRTNGPVVKWNKSERSFEEINIVEDDTEEIAKYGDIICLNNRIFLLPQVANDIIEFYGHNNTMKVFKENISEVSKCIVGKTLLLFSLKSYYLYIYRNNFINCKRIQITYPIELETYHRKKLSYSYNVLNYKKEYDSKTNLHEECNDMLKKYIDYVAGVNTSLNELSNRHVGNAVWTDMNEVC